MSGDASKAARMDRRGEARRGLERRDEEAAAQGCFVILPPGKRRVIRILERVLYPAVRAWERLRPRSGNACDSIQEILVVEYSNLGDIVLSLPFLRNLRGLYPAARITLLINPSVLELLKQEDLADELVCVRVPWAEHFSRLRKWNPVSILWFALARRLLLLRRKQFDLAFSVRGDVRENFLLWLTGAKRRIGYAFGGGAFCLTDAVMPETGRPHISERWLRLLEYLGNPVLERQPRLRIQSSEARFASQFLAGRGIRDGNLLVGIHPYARTSARRWSEENFRIVARRLQEEFSATILWFGDPGGKERDEEGRNGIVPVRLPLREFIAVLSRCKLLICNDGGQMHMATAVQVPVVAVFGPTEPAWYGPMGERNRVVLQTGFWCRPCGERCIFDQPHCIRTISVEQVWDGAAGLIRSLVSESFSKAAGGLSGNLPPLPEAVARRL